jgi:hypothetical protein
VGEGPGERGVKDARQVERDVLDGPAEAPGGLLAGPLDFVPEARDFLPDLVEPGARVIADVYGDLDTRGRRSPPPLR